MHRNLALAAALALAACSPNFDPASKLEKLRVLAIKAEPPEIAPPPAPGDPVVAPTTAALTSLVLHPTDLDPATATTTTVVHLVCVPTPGNATPTPCVALAELRDPTSEIASAAQAACAGGSGGSGSGQPPPVFAGVEACHGGTCGPASVGGTPLPPAQVTVPGTPAQPFAFTASGPDRVLGVQAVDLAFAIDATPDELVAGAGTCLPAALAARLAVLWNDPAREHVLSTKRVVIRGPDLSVTTDPPNLNPSSPQIDAGGTPLDPVGPTTASGTIQLTATSPPSDAQPYTKLDASGNPIESTNEQLVYSWFSTAGDLHDLHTQDGAADAWDLSAAPGGPAVLVAVVRDLRGGTSWAIRTVAVNR